jgi:hypothetical protein
MNATTAAQLATLRTDSIKADYNSLRKLDKAALATEYRRSHRVCDVRGMSKTELVFGVLASRYGAKAVDAVLL